MQEKPSSEELQNRVKELEKQLIKQKRFRNINNVLFQISNAINKASGLDGLYQTIHRVLSSIVDATNFYISIYDKLTDKAIFPYCIDSVDQSYPPSFQISKTESLTAEVIRTGKPLMMRKEEIIKRRNLSLQNVPSCTPAEIWLGVPLKTNDGIIGVMAVQSYTDPNRYDKTDMEVLLSVADQIAITIEFKRMEQGLRESEQRFRHVFNYTSSGVAIYESPDNGQSFIFKDLNKIGLAPVQKTRDEIIGCEVREIFPGVIDLGLFNVFRRVWKTGTPEHYPSTMYKDDKILLWVENYVCKLPSGELVAIYADRTAQKEIEQSKKRLEQQIQQSQKMESIGTLAGGIAHDFNNILFPIIGHTEMLMEDIPDNDPGQNSLNEIYKSALRAKDLVKQILTFSRQEKSEFKLIKMHSVVKEALKLIRSTIPTTIDINQYINDDCGIINADPTQIHQIIMNLATNAYHAMEETGRGELKVSLKEVEIGKHDLITPGMQSGFYVCLAIADTGIGMDQDLTEKIFDPFFTTKDQGKGTGMGLSMVHGIVHRMGGTIKVWSEPGKGTEFKIYLPVVKKSSFEKQKILSNQIIKGGTEHILLVDDDKSIIEMEELVLKRLGYHVTSYTDSSKTLEIFRANPDDFDVVITDMAMPNISGDQLAVELKKIRPDILILLCTGFSEIMSEQEAESLGISAFLLKPILMKDIALKIREVIDKKIERP